MLKMIKSVLNVSDMFSELVIYLIIAAHTIQSLLPAWYIFFLHRFQILQPDILFYMEGLPVQKHSCKHILCCRMIKSLLKKTEKEFFS